VAAVSVGAGAAAPATILVVDDNPVNLQVLVKTLHDTGHRILAARDSAAALEIVRRTRPDLVLLDVMMPGQDGFELCKAIRGDPAAADTMVIFLSALGQTSDKVLGLTLGAVDYITKPIQTEEVLARVSNHLARQHLEREVRRHRDRLNQELDSAARMQRLLLPRVLPERPGVELAAHYHTSRHAGGDYYDVLDLGDRGLGLFVADVSGHGAPAAIVMAMLRAVLHSYGEPGNPAAVLRHLNQHFHYLWDTSMFATAIYGVLEPGSHRLRLACAGHPPPLLYQRGTARVAPAPVDGVLPLLLMAIDDVPTTEIQLQTGDRLLFYTDGVTERIAPNGGMYDGERLAQALEAAASRPASEIVRQLTADIEAFAAGQEAEDDLTLLVLGLSE
jgi:sigma-B regulation protein RsbU (phosphoserine phosphatase)